MMFSSTLHKRLVLCGIIVATGLCDVHAQEEPDLELIETPRFSEVKIRVLDEVASRKIENKAILEEISQLWSEPESIPSAQKIFARVIQTLRMIDSDTDKFVSACRLTAAPWEIPAPEILKTSQNSEFHRMQLIQFYAVYLVRMKHYDEALPYFDQLELSHSPIHPQRFSIKRSLKRNCS